MSADETADEQGLFDVDEVPRPPGSIGRVEGGLMRAVKAGQEAGTLVEEDLGLIGAALVGARALDAAERMAKPAYAVAALLTPFRECLAALRLPAAVTPAAGRVPTSDASDAPDWMRDAFGTPGT